MPRYHKIHDIFSSISSFYRYTLTMLILLFISSVWFLFIFSANEKKLIKINAKIATLRKVDRMPNKAHPTVFAGRNEVAQLQLMLNKNTKNRMQDLGQGIDSILHYATSVGLQVGACMPQEEKKKEWYSVQTVVFNFTGSFDRVLAFLDRLRAARSKIRCGSMELEQIDQQQLSMRCTLRLYQFDEQ